MTTPTAHNRHYRTTIAPSERTLMAIWDQLTWLRNERGEAHAHERPHTPVRRAGGRRSAAASQLFPTCTRSAILLWCRAAILRGREACALHAHEPRTPRFRNPKYWRHHGSPCAWFAALPYTNPTDVQQARLFQAGLLVWLGFGLIAAASNFSLIPQENLPHRRP